jgi:hypothetical protein
MRPLVADNLHVTSQDAATAALLWISALTNRLVRKDVLTVNEANEIGAAAAAMCRANGALGGGDLIEAIFPASKGASLVMTAKERGAANDVDAGQAARPK